MSCALGAVALDVVDQPAVREQADGVQGHGERPRGQLVERAGVAGREHVDALGAERDRVRDRRVVRHAAVHQRAVPPRHRRQDAGHAALAEHGLEDRPGREPELLAGEDVDGDDVQRDRQVLEARGLDVALDQRAAGRTRDEMVTGADESEQAGERVERERLPAAQAAPDLPERVGGRDGLRPGRDERAVERAGRRPDDEVRRDAALVEGAEHPDLDGAEARSAGEDEGDGGSAARCHHPGLRRPGARCYASPAPTGRTQTQLFVSGPTRSLRAGPNSASTSRRPSSAMSSQCALGAEAPVAAVGAPAGASARTAAARGARSGTSGAGVWTYHPRARRA